MTFATHAIVGGAVATLFPNHPVIAFLAGFFSHFILDAIPHWDYKILSAYANPDFALSTDKNKPDKYLFLDLLHISADLLLGFLVALLFFYPTNASQFEILALGMIGGILPDFLQFVYTRFPHQPMVLIQRFHDFMHTNLKLKERPYLGIFLQIVTVIFAVLLTKYLIQF